MQEQITVTVDAFNVGPQEVTVTPEMQVWELKGKAGITATFTATYKDCERVVYLENNHPVMGFVEDGGRITFVPGPLPYHTMPEDIDTDDHEVSPPEPVPEREWNAFPQQEPD